jgi:hypothetical protein
MWSRSTGSTNISKRTEIKTLENSITNRDQVCEQQCLYINGSAEKFTVRVSIDSSVREGEGKRGHVGAFQGSPPPRQEQGTAEIVNWITITSGAALAPGDTEGDMCTFDCFV